MWVAPPNFGPTLSALKVAYQSSDLEDSVEKEKRKTEKKKETSVVK